MKRVLNRIRGKRDGKEAAGSAAGAERMRRSGEPEKAVAMCRAELERAPEQISARVTLGWALLDLRRYDEARVELEQVLKRAPDNLAAIRGLAQLHDHVENAAMVSLERAGDWPPRPTDIEQAAEEAADRAAAIEESHLAMAARAAVEAPRPQAEPSRARTLGALEALGERAKARRLRVAPESAA